MNLLTWEEAFDLRRGRRLVFTNGVFDIVHAGHVDYLRRARELGEMLLVGLNSDASVHGLGKGPCRPVNPLEARAAVVAGLRAVDGVVSFEEATPERIIEFLKPEFHVKGGDYDPESMPETALVRSYGGQVVVLPFLEGFSTSAILRKLGVE